MQGGPRRPCPDRSYPSRSVLGQVTKPAREGSFRRYWIASSGRSIGIREHLSAPKSSSRCHQGPLPEHAVVVLLGLEAAKSAGLRLVLQRMAKREVRRLFRRGWFVGGLFGIRQRV